jgi:autotransporter-associated beta strand protein
MEFVSGASAYTFNTGTFHFVTLTGAGIVNNSSNAPTFENFLGFMEFQNSASAGNAIFNNNPGSITFSGTSTAANAQITSSSSGLVSFTENATGGNATITSNNGAKTQFVGSSNPGNARLIANGSGIMEFSGTTGPSGNGQITAGSIEGSGTFNLGSNQLTVGGNNLSTTVSGTINEGGEFGGTGASLVKTGTGTLTLSGINTYSGGTTFAGGTVSVSANENLGAASGSLTFSGGTLQITGTSFTSLNRTVNWGSQGGGFDIVEAANTFTVSQNLSGSGGLSKLGAGTLVLSGNNSYSGATSVQGGTLAAGSTNAFGSNSAVTVSSGATLALNNFNVAIGSLAGAGNVSLGSGRLTAGGNNSSTTFSGVMSGSGGYTKTGSGTTTLIGTNSYTGATNVSSGTLVVNGSIASSSMTTIASGATVRGTGSLGSTTVESGGTLWPGNSIGTINVSGNLTFSSGSSYNVEVSPSAASRTNVSGLATLAGTVNAIFSSGSYVGRSYTILSSAGGISGQFNALNTTGLGSGFQTSLSYTSTEVLLNLYAALGLGAGLNTNQSNVAGALNNYFNNGGSLPPGFASVFGLTGASLANALTQLSGEAATGAATAGFRSMNPFLSLMVDPFGGALVDGAAAQELSAYASAASAGPHAFAQRWNVWAASYGDWASADGNATVGSHDVNARSYGIAAGADYRLDSATRLGFALSGGGANWTLSDALGGGRSDVFQFGIYGAHAFGPAYVAGALAYAWHGVTTTRTVTVAGTDMFAASFNADGLGARLEGGYRFDTPVVAVTPFAAVQLEQFYTPAYSESVTGGANTFALNYAAATADASRSELGLWLEKTGPVLPAATVVLRARAAWAHYWSGAPAMTAGFQTLPGTSFVVTGAAPPSDSALMMAGAEVRLAGDLSLGLRVDAELSGRGQSVGAKGELHQRW